jgi:hypothetical protein
MTNCTHTLESDAHRLYELNRLFVKAVVESDKNELQRVVPEYVMIKKRLKSNFMGNPAVCVNDSKALSVLQKIAEDKNLPADDIIAALDMPDASESFMSLSYEEIEEYGSDIFYSWFSHHEYIRGLYEIGSLIIGLSVPGHLKRFVSEAKECYAFMQYNAVYSLCRTILEASVRHIGEKKNLLRNRKGNVIPIEKFRWEDMKNRIAPVSMKTAIESIYAETSSLVHGRKTITSKEARDAFRETLRIVHLLYNHHTIDL